MAYDLASGTREILLVQPPQRGLLNGFAGGLMDIANFITLREPACRVSILDWSLTPLTQLRVQVRAALKGKPCPPVTGITTTSAGYHAALAVAKAFKAEAPQCMVVLGGHHASPEHAVVLRHHRDIVNAVVQGEGERAMLALARGTDPVLIPGMAVVDRGHIKANPPGPLLRDEELDTLPVDMGKCIFHSAPGKFDHATYVSARGCPLHCAFCAVAAQPIRAKSITRVLSDLRYLIVERGYRKIAIEDNFFAQSRSRALALCDGIAGLRDELGIDFSWDCQTRVESMRSVEVIQAFERAGCDGVYLGVESLIEEELVYLGKSPRPERYVELVGEVVGRILDTTIGCYINLQVALPRENDERRHTRLNRLGALGRFAARHGKTIMVFPQLSVVYPGTAHFAAAVAQADFGPHSRDIFEPFTEWEAEQEPVLRFVGENFAHGVGGIPVGMLDPQRLKRGTFAVKEDEVGQLKDHMARLESVNGINLFKYGAHLARDEEASQVAATG